ncbi:2-oxo-tetronate isomerase [Roseomonas xinghualingensis]|uniref:2-oxo-tetronate isomerase n=1 Tax=Roseomonas xinghualingensis TaxID=2986475 RepID=UPI0021F23101|nr:2-oxo-tetronate isomerase [Roseomonas sp. SXEYE001]MCV4209118.1 hydroxypyruvate isomerase family protein [Roseomonas sp. SXEYE001]
MPRFAANISLMFTEVPFLDRFDRARAAGFEAVEFLFPYTHPAAEIRTRLDNAGLSVVLFNAAQGDWENGEKGLAALPGREDEFRDGMARALDYASELGCPRLHVMAGLAPEGVARDTLTATYAANLAWAAERCWPQGVKPLIEPINHRDIPGYILNTTTQAAAIIEAIGPERLGLQFDLYHGQVTEGDITRRFEALLPFIAHAQLADTPGRHEPGTGEVNWPFVLGRLDAMGYRGWIGCEYRPAGNTEDGLGWFAPYRA